MNQIKKIISAMGADISTSPGLFNKEQKFYKNIILGDLRKGFKEAKTVEERAKYYDLFLKKSATHRYDIVI